MCRDAFCNHKDHKSDNSDQISSYDQIVTLCFAHLVLSCAFVLARATWQPGQESTASRLLVPLPKDGKKNSSCIVLSCFFLVPPCQTTMKRNCTPEVGKTCQLQGKCRWTPLTRPRSLCTVLAAAAMMAAFPSSTTSAAQHRRHCFAWRLMFAARQIHHACAADAVRLGASRSLHAAKHRASSFAV